MLINYNQVIPGRLWVGAFVRPDDVRQLHRMGITTVFSLQTDKDVRQNRISLEKLVKELQERNIDFRQVPVQEFDEKDLERQLPECVSVLEAELKPDLSCRS